MSHGLILAESWLYKPICTFYGLAHCVAQWALQKENPAFNQSFSQIFVSTELIWNTTTKHFIKLQRLSAVNTQLSVGDVHFHLGLKCTTSVLHWLKDVPSFRIWIAHNLVLSEARAWLPWHQFQLRLVPKTHNNNVWPKSKNVWTHNKNYGHEKNFNPTTKTEQKCSTHLKNA